MRGLTWLIAILLCAVLAWIAFEPAADDGGTGGCGAVSSAGVPIPLTRVRGQVLIGDQPLAGATLSFLDEGCAIRVRSGADGRFAVDLPAEMADGIWPAVEIESESPRIRTIAGEVRIANGEVTIHVPNRR